MRVLISGFEPFGGESINPTALLVQELERDPSFFAREGLALKGVLLPVTFDEAFAKLNEEIQVWSPDVVLAFGQAGGRSAVEVERVAINCIDADIPDNKGHQPRDLPLIDGGAAAHFTTLPMREIIESLQQAGVPARVSNTAGTYVCNSLFYRLQTQEANAQSGRRTGFIHVPYLPEQVVSREGVPSLPFETLKNALRAIIEAL